MAAATKGAAWNLWLFKATASSASVYIGAQLPDGVMITGTLKGKGVIYRALVTGDPLLSGAFDTSTFTVNAASGVATVSGPTGGMSQFKGLTQSSNQDAYVQTICLSIQPMYYETWPLNLIDGVSNGWVLSCYTGIPQCAVKLSDAIEVLDNTSSTQTADCMNDPRYLTWRVMTMKIDKNATVSWYRVDSYWDAAAT